MAAESSALASKARKPGRRYFSVTEANRSLPYVRRVVDDIVGCYGGVVALRKQIEKPSAGESREQLEAAYDLSMDRLSDLVDELQQVGVELKDFEKGFVDFPAMHQGREIFLSWHQGLANIEGWHEPNSSPTELHAISTLEA